MIKKVLSYALAVGFLGIVVAFIANAVLSYLPYVGVALVLFVPIYGYIRKKKNWTTKHSGVKAWFKNVRPIFAVNRNTMLFYLVAGVAISLLFQQIVWVVAETVMISAGALLSFYILWEGVRWVLKKWKSITIISFGEALKSGW